MYKDLDSGDVYHVLTEVDNSAIFGNTMIAEILISNSDLYDVGILLYLDKSSDFYHFQKLNK